MIRDLNNEVGIRNLAAGEDGKAALYWYRIAVRKSEDNQTLLSALGRIGEGRPLTRRFVLSHEAVRGGE